MLGLNQLCGFGADGSGPTMAPCAIGDAYGGGYFAGMINVNGLGSIGTATHFLILAPKASGEINGKFFFNSGPPDTFHGITSRTDGPGNSAAWAALSANYQAATWCEGLSIGGYTDWYLPAADEFEIIYYHLKTFPYNNDTAYGVNPYAVFPQPNATNYTLTVPPQTSLTAFTVGGSEAFSAYTVYHTSTEVSDAQIRVCTQQDGSLPGGNKGNPAWTRAIRRVPV